MQERIFKNEASKICERQPLKKFSNGKTCYRQTINFNFSFAPFSNSFSNTNPVTLGIH